MCHNPLKLWVVGFVALVVVFIVDVVVVVIVFVVCVTVYIVVSTACQKRSLGIRRSASKILGAPKK